MTFNATAPTSATFSHTEQATTRSWLDSAWTKAAWSIFVTGHGLFALLLGTAPLFMLFGGEPDSMDYAQSATQYGAGVAILLAATVGLLCLYGRTWILLPVVLFGLVLSLSAADSFGTSDFSRDATGVSGYLLAVAVEAGTRLGAWPILIGAGFGIHRVITSRQVSHSR